MNSFFTSKRKIYIGLIGVLVCVNMVAWQQVFALTVTHYLKVDVLDIGQGDAIFIETPLFHHILIDGGPDASVLEKLQTVLPFGERSLDMVILTHPDADHLVGLLSVLQYYKIKYIVWTGMVRDGANYQKWVELLAKAKQQGSTILIATPSLKIASGDVSIDTLHPFESIENQYIGKNDNDTGIVSHVVFGKRSFLFTGDISSAVEQELINAKASIASDVLKIPHHGSKYSSSEAFLEAVHPSIAVISVGAHNSYGHPTPEVLQRLENFGIKTLRTDQLGDVEIISDGDSLQIKN